ATSARPEKVFTSRVVALSESLGPTSWTHYSGRSPAGVPCSIATSFVPKPSTLLDPCASCRWRAREVRRTCLCYILTRCNHEPTTNRSVAMIVFDAHLDLAWNALDWNRDLLRPVEEIRHREREQKMADKARGSNTVSFPELRRGKVAVFIATLLARSLQPN